MYAIDQYAVCLCVFMFVVKIVPRCHYFWAYELHVYEWECILQQLKTAILVKTSKHILIWKSFVYCFNKIFHLDKCSKGWVCFPTLNKPSEFFCVDISVQTFPSCSKLLTVTLYQNRSWYCSTAFISMWLCCWGFKRWSWVCELVSYMGACDDFLFLCCYFVNHVFQ